MNGKDKDIEKKSFQGITLTFRSRDISKETKNRNYNVESLRKLRYIKRNEVTKERETTTGTENAMS